MHADQNKHVTGTSTQAWKTKAHHLLVARPTQGDAKAPEADSRHRRVRFSSHPEGDLPATRFRRLAARLERHGSSSRCSATRMRGMQRCLRPLLCKRPSWSMTACGTAEVRTRRRRESVTTFFNKTFNFSTTNRRKKGCYMKTCLRVETANNRIRDVERERR